MTILIGGGWPPTFPGFYIAPPPPPHFYTKLMVRAPHFEFTSSADDTLYIIAQFITYPTDVHGGPDEPVQQDFPLLV